MQELEKLYKKALAKKGQQEFNQAIIDDADKTFVRICNYIGLDHTRTFHNGKNAVYQLEIKKIDNKFKVVETTIDQKLLKSLIGNNQNAIDKFFKYAKEHKLLKNPKVLYNYGFYYRHSGKILPHTLANFDKESGNFNRETGEIRIFASIPEVVKNSSILPLYIDALCSNPHTFMQWLSLFAFELRYGVKKPSLCLHGEYSFPILALIESIYPNGFIQSQHKTIPSACKFNDFQAKCFSWNSLAQDHRKLSRLFNHFGRNAIYGNTYLVMTMPRVVTKKIQYQDNTCFNVFLYSKEQQIEHLRKIGAESYIDIVKNEIGAFCRKYLHQYYKEAMQDEDNIACKDGIIEHLPDDYMTDEQIVEFAKFIVRKIKKTDIDYFKFETSNYIANKVISYEFIEYYCLLFNINHDYFINKLRELGVIADMIAELDTPFGIKNGVLFTWSSFINKGCF